MAELFSNTAPSAEKPLKLARWLDGAIFVGFLTALAGAPLLYGSDNQAAIELLTVVLIALFFLWAMLAVVQKEVRFVWSPIHATLVAFLILALIQLLPLPMALRAVGVDGTLVGGEPGPLGWSRITLDPHATTSAAAKLAMLIGYFFIASTFISTVRRAQAAATVLLVTGFVVSVIGIINSLAPESALLWKFPPESLSFGPFVNRAHFSGFAEMTLPLGLAMVFSGSAERDRWLLFLFMTLVIGCAVFMSASRAGMGIVLLEVIGLPLLAIRQRSWVTGGRTLAGLRPAARMALVGLLLACAIGGSVAWVGSESTLKRISQRFFDVQQLMTSGQQPVAVRPEIWRATVKMIDDNPILGVGLGAFAVAYPRYDRWNGLSLTAEAHNDYLQVLSDTGVVGALIGIVFLVTLVRVMRCALRGQSASERGIALGASVGCAALLAHSLVDFNLQITANALVFLTLVALLIRVQPSGE
jgi:O-antigen ligase